MDTVPTDDDYYSILGVPRDASPAEIRTAYRRLALKHHPDKNNGNAEQAAAASTRFTRVSEAYEVLLNPDTRREYDGTGCTAGVHFQNPEDLFRSFFDTLAESGFFCVDEEIIGEFFDGPEVGIALRTLSHMPSTGVMMHSLRTYAKGTTMEPVVSKINDVIAGTNKPRSSRPRTPDIHIEVTVTLEEVYTRKLKKVMRRRVRRTPDGSYEQNEHPFIIPLYEPRVVYRGQADQLQDDDEAGDVVFSVVVQSHAVFNRLKNPHDILIIKRVSLYEVCHGCKFYVRNLDGNMLKISTRRAIQGCRWQRVRGGGLPVDRKTEERGDLIVKFVLDDDISATQLQGLKELFPPIAGEGVLLEHDDPCPEVTLEPCETR